MSAGTLTVVGGWPNAKAVSQHVQLTGGSSVNNVTVTLPAAQTVGAALWHPHGHGKQVLHNVYVKFRLYFLYFGCFELDVRRYT